MIMPLSVLNHRIEIEIQKSRRNGGQVLSTTVLRTSNFEVYEIISLQELDESSVALKVRFTILLPPKELNKSSHRQRHNIIISINQSILKGDVHKPQTHHCCAASTYGVQYKVRNKLKSKELV